MENNEKEIEEIVTVEEDMNEKDNANNVNNRVLFQLFSPEITHFREDTSSMLKTS